MPPAFGFHRIITLGQGFTAIRHRQQKGAGMTPELTVDARAFFALSGEFARLPRQIKTTVMRRAYGRVIGMAQTRVVRLSAKRISIPQKHVRARTKPGFARGMSRSIKVKSGWIPLAELGARAGRRGAIVKGRKSVRGSFMATMGNGHAGVFKRTGKSRLPIYQLYGPNPANDIVTSPKPFEDVLYQVARDNLAPRMLHELTRILPSS